MGRLESNGVRAGGQTIYEKIQAMTVDGHKPLAAVVRDE